MRIISMRISSLQWLIAVSLGALMLPALQAQEPAPGAFSQLMTLSDHSSGRVSSFDRTGGNQDFNPIAPGETLSLASLAGAGIIRHLYFSIWGGEHYLRNLVLRAYWDGQETPCVELPFGDFFGLGQERPRFFTSLLVTVNPGDVGVFGTFGFNSYFPMPFANGARLTLTNEGTEAIPAVWYHVEFEQMKQLPEGLGRFHATWNRVNKTEPVGENINITLHDARNTTGAENYVLLDAEGRGTLAGIFLNIDNTMGNWYGEGDDMIFIDGEEWPPSYHGTGSEEIFGGGACPTDEYAGPYTGFHLIGNLDYTGKVSMYRFYVNDPVRFQKSIRMTIEHGHANNIANDYSSTAFWYQADPHKPFRALLPAAERHPAWGDDPHDAAYGALMVLRVKAFVLLVQAIRDGQELPDDLVQLMKYDISQTYFRREYGKLHEQVAVLGARLDELIERSLAEPSGDGAEESGEGQP
jgi:hypothetical protein